MRSEKQRLLSWSKTASLAPWLSNTDLITGPGMQAGLNGRLLTQTQTGFSIFKANILSVIQHHFSCAEVGLTMPVGRCEDVREQFVRFSPPRAMSPCRHLWQRNCNNDLQLYGRLCYTSKKSWPTQRMLRRIILQHKNRIEDRKWYFSKRFGTWAVTGLHQIICTYCKSKSLFMFLAYTYNSVNYNSMFVIKI